MSRLSTKANARAHTRLDTSLDWTDEKKWQGEKTFPYYEGQFLDGMRHGKGIYNYANGDYYSGMWKFNLPDGQGTYLWNGGDHLECKWMAGVRFVCTRMLAWAHACLLYAGLIYRLRVCTVARVCADSRYGMLAKARH
jgi:hypothetical protein